MSSIESTRYSAKAGGRFASPSVCDLLQILASTTRTWRKRRHYRRDLNRLLKVGGYMIDDIGLPLEQAKKEAKKTFWIE